MEKIEYKKPELVEFDYNKISLAQGLSCSNIGNSSMPNGCEDLVSTPDE